jgi:hypothetical protein
MSETRATYQAGEPDTMRDLLRRWAELEPDEFNQDLNTISDSESLTRMDVQAKIQYALQAVIVNKGWCFRVGYEPTLEPANYEAWVVSPEVGLGARKQDGNPARVLLATYLQALETIKKAG